jgi:hypothetical protein
MLFKKRTEFLGDKSLLPENRYHSVSSSRQGWIAQLVEQRTENPRVPGSIPGPATSPLKVILSGFAGENGLQFQNLKNVYLAIILQSLGSKCRASSAVSSADEKS